MPLKVLISGAGVAGPSLAWFLARTGAEVTVLEKASALLPHGQNVDIAGSAAREVVRRMGLKDAIQRNHTTESGTLIVDTTGKAFAKFPVVSGSEVSPTSEFEILRGDLAKLLWEATKDNVTYLLGTTIKHVLENDDGEERVVVELSDGRKMTCDILVAADGQWSKLRRMVFPDEDIKVIDRDMSAAYWTIPRLPTDNDWWNVYFPGKSRVITTRPDPHGTYRAMFTSMPISQKQRDEWRNAAKNGKQAQTDLLKREFEGSGWQSQRLLDSMEEAPDFYFQPIQQIQMKKWSSGRIVCLGDAAHAASPLSGMGTSLAIVGAYVLGGELSKLTPGEHPTKAFKSYEAAYRPFVDGVQDIPFFVPGIGHPSGVVGKWMLETGLTILSKVVKIPWVIRKLSQPDNSIDYKLPDYEAFTGLPETLQKM